MKKLKLWPARIVLSLPVGLLLILGSLAVAVVHKEIAVTALLVAGVIVLVFVGWEYKS
jgi:hypothetical protein